MNSVARVRELLRIRSKTNYSNRKLAEMLGCSHQTVGRDLKLITQLSLTYEQVAQRDDDELILLLAPWAPLALQKKRLPDFAVWVKALTKKHQTIYNLIALYTREDPATAYAPSTLYQHFKEYLKTTKLEALLEHCPGEEAQFDFCGEIVCLSPYNSAKKVWYSVFVGVLCYSKYFLAYATPGQTTNDWIAGTKAFFNYIGGVPQIGIPDNPKAVAAQPRPNLKLNLMYAAFVEHYGFIAMPARPGEPRDKGIVEETVRFVTERVLVNMQSMAFRTSDEINDYLRKECDKLNALQFQKRSVSRRELFESGDKPALTALPAKPFKPIEHAFGCTIPSNYRVMFEEHLYSVPWRWANNKAEVIITQDEVTIRHANKFPVVHKRSFEKGKETVETRHLHASHKGMVRLPQSEFTRWAETVGEQTTQFIQQLFAGKADGDIVANKACKSVQSLANKYTAEEMEEAARYCITYDKYSPTSLRHTLASRLYEDTGADISLVGKHKNLHAPQHFQNMGRSS
ncbi:IS21 family transposase [Pseudoalteromonas sp. OOF1S-7]|uniref:IS21 family transposase n=1 Tax=Pseudoalteromonas sp. OOF1S-7 TaxID=2917757 RepID=UPI001EF52CE1|nr:IS21 family transposase [Pseudoalteromonas sp. OOF1S-7]MCG7537906.1 IS21 family transposase [Pseudoalteromonas sp. OOF1S-7]